MNLQFIRKVFIASISCIHLWQHMNVYKSRTASAFHDRLGKLLSVSGPNGLTDRAVEPSGPVNHARDVDFNHCITLDYIGDSASQLLDRTGQLVDRCYFEELCDIIDITSQLNDDGFFVKIRLLLLYPYSAAGQIRIQSEDSHRRTSVNNPTNQDLRQPDLATIQGSNFLGLVERNLDNLNELRDDLGEEHAIYRRPNMFEVRFCPANPMTWGLRVNNSVFFQPYMYGKEERYDSFCPTHEIPVMELKESDGLSYNLLLDHFRHLWEYDATIVADDGVQWHSSHTRLKSPPAINFFEKARREVGDEEGDFNKNAKRRSEKLQARLDPHCPDQAPPPDEEIVFISSSWPNDSSKSSGPQPDAKVLENLINDYFQEHQAVDDVRDIEPWLVDTPPGKKFTDRVYEGLERATLGIVILTPEITPNDTNQPISSPNVYHELGYLMSNIEPNRTYIFTTGDVDPPSNVSGKTHVSYNNMYEGFVELLKALEGNGVISENDQERVAQAYHDSVFDMEDLEDKEDIRAKLQNYITREILDK